MEKEQITLAQVYRINGRLVVANSQEDAVNIWREWMSPNCPAIKSIKRIGNDPTLHIGNEALVFKEGLYDDNVSQFLDNIEKQYGDRQHLQHGLPGGDEADSRRKH